MATTKTRSDESVITEDDVPKGLMGMVRFALRHYGAMGTLGRYLIMKDDVRRFVRRGASPEDRAFRAGLVKRFGAIQRHIPCAHSPYQFVLMADYLLDLDVPGPIVECGCYLGGSTAKLSLLAERTGRTLYVCDSFEGLPEAAEEELRRRGHGSAGAAFAPGEYRGPIDVVRANVARYGCLDRCVFVPGFFDRSLPDLDVRPAFVFIDVDYVSSARDCLTHLWPRLEAGGYWFTHEAWLPDYMEGMLDAGFWRTTFDECPPLAMGAGSGLAVNASSIAYIRKRRAG